jgi:quercetin dioxygenase-like cupin family protein
VRHGGPPVHVHEAGDEVVIVLEAELTYQVGDEHGVVAAGGLLWFPRAVPHAIAIPTAPAGS